MNAAQAAPMLRYANRYVIHANRRLGYFPHPDAYGPAARGRPAPLWKRSTVWAVAGRRPGTGGGHKPGTPAAPAKPHPYAGTSGWTASWPSSARACGRRRRGSSRSGARVGGRRPGSAAPRGLSCRYKSFRWNGRW